LTAGNSVHRIWRFGSDIDTDQLAPGAYMQLGISEIAPHCLESVRPDFAPGVKTGDILVAGENFGIGSSREQAASVLVCLGVKAVVAPSYSGLFFRNAFNVGLLLLTCAHADQLQEGEHIQLDLKNWQIQRGASQPLFCTPVPEFLMEIVSAGGLLNHLKALQNKSRGAY
jgi:3-isopropylmalate/(R)-2-methylmalate dehydratase small subunit